jgi:hypothetical protein
VDDGSLSYFVGLQRVLFKGGASESDSLSGVNGLNWGTDSDDDDNDVCDLSLTWASKTHGGEMVASTEGLPVAHCGTCEKAANGIIRLVVVGCITQVFQMTTDLQRTTRLGFVSVETFLFDQPSSQPCTLKGLRLLTLLLRPDLARPLSLLQFILSCPLHLVVLITTTSLVVLVAAAAAAAAQGMAT